MVENLYLTLGFRRIHNILVYVIFVDKPTQEENKEVFLVPIYIWNLDPNVLQTLKQSLNLGRAYMAHNNG
jgi:hypothetical protein